MSEGTTKETTRLEAFSDAVFAIAITILALELRLPDLDDDTNVRLALLKMWPAYVAYLLSFSSILIMWLNHHAVLLWVRKVEGRLMVANGILLMLVAAVPFPAALIGGLLGEPGQRFAMVAFCLLFMGITLAFAWMWGTISRHRKHIAPTLPPKDIRRAAVYLSVSFAGYLVALVASLFSAMVGMLIALGMAGFWLWVAYTRHRAIIEKEIESKKRGKRSSA